MKVLYVSPYPPSHDGIGTYTHMLAEAAREHGHDVRVIVPRITPQTSPEVIGAVSLRGRESRNLVEAIVKWDPDVVHVQFAIAAFGARTATLLRWLDVLRRELSAPVVGTLHEVTRDTALLRATGREIYRRMAARCDHVIVHTHGAYSALTGRIGVPRAKAVMIPHPAARPPVGITTPEQLRGRLGLGDARILLAFGFIHPDKGLDDLVRALDVLHQAGAALLDDVRVVVAGAVRPRHGLFRVFEARDRLYLRRTLREARRKSLHQYLVFTGYVPDSDVSAWFRAAEAIVLPYRRTEQSGVASMATAFAVPVLASTVGGLQEQFAGSRWSFPPGAPESLARVLTAFLAARPPEQTQLSPLRPASDLSAVMRATFELYREDALDHAR